MKSSKTFSLLTIMLLLAVSCQKSTVYMLTVINPDGSCDKEFTNNVDWQFMKGDTTNYSRFFPVEMDSTWQVEWRYNNGEIHTNFPLKSSDSVSMKINADSRNFQVKIKKHFASVHEMSELSPVNEWNGAKISYNLTKRFRWFFTYYTYTETYPKLPMPTYGVPISKYMTDEEAHFWFNDKSALSAGMNGMEINDLTRNLEDKYNKWVANIVWNENYKIYAANYDKLSNPPVSRERFEQLSDTVFEKKGKEIIDDENYAIYKVLDSYFQSKVFSEFTVKNDSLFKKLSEELEENDLFFEKYLYNYSLQLPGKIISGNFYAQNDGTLHWKVTSARMFLQDYTIRAQSRMANWWAFALALLLIAFVVGLPFAKKRAKF